MPRHLNSRNIESDSFDRERFAELLESSGELSALLESGSLLLPNFYDFMSDVFASFYKHNIVMIPPEEIAEASRLGRQYLDYLLADPHHRTLRDDTVLDTFRSGLATLGVCGDFLAWLRSDHGVGERSLLKDWEIDKLEQENKDLADEIRTIEEVIEDSQDQNETLDTLLRDKKDELRDGEDELGELVGEQSKRREQSDINMKKDAKLSIKQTTQTMDDIEDELTEWGANMGMASTRGVGEKLDLAQSLCRNEKLKRLSRMVGSLKQEMLTSRRKAWSRRGSEVYDIAYGGELGKVIQSQLLSLRHKTLIKDFQRKLLESKLLQYSLREDKGRGPIVVCVDGSSSMEGDKEIWAKGVCLTLLEMAKRERRKFNVLVFSSGGGPMRTYESHGVERWGMREQDVLDLADYFPGGGTDFTAPLDRAGELLGESKFKNGDVVFITDGEAEVSEDWALSFNTLKKDLRFKVLSILIDVTGRESTRSLEVFSDNITAISKLTSEGARDIFLKLN